MASSLRIILLCTFVIFFLNQVDGKIARRQRRHDEISHEVVDPMEEIKEILEENEQLTEDDRRGILDVLLGRPQNTPQIAPPGIAPATPILTAGQPIPTNSNTNRTLLQLLFMNSPFGNLVETGNGLDGFNQRWINRALEKCAKIDPNLLTVALPTTDNGLREPRMYYFKNVSTNLLLWGQAQEWCTERGMDLVTVNDEYENKFLIDKIKTILNAVSVNAQNNYWIGLNDRIAPMAPPIGVGFTYIGDSSGRYMDWHTTPTATQCAWYSQATAPDNIHMGTGLCDSNTVDVARYVCEVSDACVALFMARYPTKFQHEQNHHHHHHVLP